MTIPIGESSKIARKAGSARDMTHPQIFPARYTHNPGGESEAPMRKVTRRDFVLTGAAAGVAAAGPKLLGQAPTMLTPRSAKPVVISSANGNFYKNGGTQTGVERAFALMTGGKDVLESLIAGVNLCELDPEEDSVGYGG